MSLETPIKLFQRYTVSLQEHCYTQAFHIKNCWQNCLSDFTDRNKNDVTITWPTQYSWPNAAKWMTNLKSGLKLFVKMRHEHISQPEGAIVRIAVSKNGRTDSLAIDYSDYSDISEKEAANSLLYFKMQYRKEGYNLSNVIPGGFPPNDVMLYSYLHKLRANSKLKNSANICNATTNYSTANKALYDVYGRFGKGFAFESRSKCISILSNSNTYKFKGGFEFVRYSQFLKEASSSKICIDLPGNGDFCFRLVDCLALGCFIIGMEPRNRLPVELEDRKHIVYMNSDMSDMNDLVNYYLTHEDERIAIASSAQKLFDETLSCRAIARYYLDKYAEAIDQTLTPSKVQL